MTERDIRIAMQPKWKAVQAAFIDACGGDANVMVRRLAERDAMEASLIEEYHRRVEALAYT